MTNATKQDRADQRLFHDVSRRLVRQLHAVAGSKMRDVGIRNVDTTGTHGWACELGRVGRGAYLELFYDHYLGRSDGRFFSVWICSSSGAAIDTIAGRSGVRVGSRVTRDDRAGGVLTNIERLGRWFIDDWERSGWFYFDRYPRLGHAAHGPETIVQSLLVDVRTLARQFGPKTEQKAGGPRFPPSVGRAKREVAARAGQGQFRRDVLAMFRGQCVITGCAVEHVLEAAHIVPYATLDEQDATKALLLRADLHVLFDRGLLSIVKRRGKAEVAIDPCLVGTELYGELEGASLQGAVDLDPSHWRALASRSKQARGGRSE